MFLKWVESNADAMMHLRESLVDCAQTREASPLLLWAQTKKEHGRLRCVVRLRRRRPPAAHDRLVDLFAFRRFDWLHNM